MIDESFSKKRVQAQFGKNAKEYVLSEEHVTGPDLVLATEWLQPTSDDAVLDIATGGGHVAKALAPLVKSVTVTDLTQTMLETAQTYLTENGVTNAQYVLADAETCRIAAHHFPNPDRFVHEVARVLRPNGRFILIDNVTPEDKTLGDFINLVETIRDPSHVRCLSVVEWKSLLEKQDLHVVRDTLRKKPHPFSSWVDRMAPTSAHKDAVSQMLLHTSKEVKLHFDILIEEETVVSFATHQWIALAVRG
jgi:ubiquinone/menaquinone biosynthesis C-methylase UbiE